MFKINDMVEIVKDNDSHNGEIGKICNISSLETIFVTIYDVVFEDGSKRYYFYGELKEA